MARYTQIRSLSFGQQELPLPMSVRLSRRCDARCLGGDADAFATSVQTAQPVVSAEVRLRGTAAAEGLTLGSKEALRFTVAPADGLAPNRAITVEGAVLVAVEIDYQQSALAAATLRFLAEADDGAAEPVKAEDGQ